MGLLWSFLNPALMLVVYTFFFSVVFKARWPGGGTSKTEFALVLFAGLMTFNLFAECINRAPALILGNVNYVKKIVFPLEILPVVSLGAAGFHFLVSLSVWLCFYSIFFGTPPLTIFYLPLILIPLIILILGISWGLSSLGVYLRDVSQVTGTIVMILMFMSPIFYSISALPENYHVFLKLNPLTYEIEQVRAVMIWGETLDWGRWLLQLLISSLVAWTGYIWFQKTRGGFADVL